MTEEMISTLSNVSGLTVISRTSTMQYKGAKKNLVDIGRELGAGTLLEGSVRKAGNRVRITIQLLDAKEDKHIWAQSYDRELQDIFAVQSDVATNVADALKVKLLDREAAQLRKKPTENTEAYVLYLKGREYWNKRSESAVRKAMEYFQLAIDADPDFALALVGLADSWGVLPSWGYASPSEAAPKMKQAVLKALKLDNTLAEAHTTYALELAIYEWKWEEAELEFRRAIELNPNYGTAHHWYSFSVLRLSRRLGEELREAQRALELDPLAPVMCLNMGQTLYLREEFDKAIEYYEKALAIDPNFLVAYLHQAGSYLASGRYGKGIELMEAYLPRVQTKTQTSVVLASAYGMAGRNAEAKRLLEEADQAGDKEQVPPMDFAEAYSAVGETDKMFEFMEKAALQKDVTVPHALVDPLYKRYRSDPRFIALKTKVGI
jgi:tetratricopeptide (TPR) repeat protein